MNERKAVGHDNITATFLKLSCHYSIVLSFCKIINSSINDGTFLTLWKSAKVFALHKGGSPSHINNYRPISVLSFCSKITEFSSYLRDNSLLLILSQALGNTIHVSHVCQK